VPVLKFQQRADGTLEPVWKYYAKPGGTYVKGRCVDYETGRYIATRHVLDYTPEHHFPSKHARGRVRPRTNAERQRAQRLRARFTQVSKSMTADSNKLGAIYDDI